MGGGVKDWFGMVTVSGSAINLSWVSCAVGEGGTRLDAGTAFGFLGIHTGLTLTSFRSSVYASFGDQMENFPARSWRAFAAARFAFFRADLVGDSVLFP